MHAEGELRSRNHAEKKKPNENKKLNFDTFQCGNCAGYVLVFWSASSGFQVNPARALHDYIALPYPLQADGFPQHWPKTVGRYWLQAVRNLQQENWDAAAVMARSALQAALRTSDASGSSLKAEIQSLAAKGILPPIIKEWADVCRELGNTTAHPEAEQAETPPENARDVVRFLEFLLQYLFDLPDEIRRYRERQNQKEK